MLFMISIVKFNNIPAYKILLKAIKSFFHIKIFCWKTSKVITINVWQILKYFYFTKKKNHI